MAATETQTQESPVTDPYAQPDAKVLQGALDLQVQDAKGEKLPFKSLTTPLENGPSRRLVIFIRHFFCGHCEEYVRALARDLPLSTLSAADTDLTIIGCGDPSCIPDYIARTGCPYDIYADPDRKLYDHLGMVSSLEMGTKPNYIQTSVLSGVTSSMLNIIKSGPKGLRGGKFSQNGGEWLFEGGELKWCRKMQNSRDHTEVEQLAEVLGVQQKAA